ncbi:NADH-quinone oxidoreductase subunit NuoH [candidate division KSB1 bacterium]
MPNLYNPFVEVIRVIPWLDSLSDIVQIAIAGIIAAVAVFLIICVFALFAIWLERKVSAHAQDRLGPMETGWHGVLQTVADALKLLLKEDIIPAKVDRKLFVFAPVIVFMTAIAVFVVIPFGERIIISDLNIGIVYALAISGLVVPGIIMAGWASNNKWSLLGAMRSAAQIVSYEIPVGLSVVCVIMIVGSLSMQEIVRFQEGAFWNWLVFDYRLLPFNIIVFLIYFVGSIAEINRTPFDLPEAESELVAGFMTEYTGMRWAFFFLAEYGNMFAVSAIATTMFFGGWHAPFRILEVIPGTVWFLSKVLILVFLQMWLRWTLPRLRVDQLMYVCWKVLVPFGFLCVIGVGIWQILGVR